MIATDTWLQFSDIHSDARGVEDSSLVKGGGPHQLVVTVFTVGPRVSKKARNLYLWKKKTPSFKCWQLILLTDSSMPAEENPLGLA